MNQPIIQVHANYLATQSTRSITNNPFTTKCPKARAYTNHSTIDRGAKLLDFGLIEFFPSCMLGRLLTLRVLFSPISIHSTDVIQFSGVPFCLSFENLVVNISALLKQLCLTADKANRPFKDYCINFIYTLICERNEDKIWKRMKTQCCVST